MGHRGEELHDALNAEKLRDALSCPFCGNERLGVFEGPSPNLIPRDSWYVACPRCLSNGPYGRTVDQAIHRWNGRTDGETAYFNE